LDFSEAYGGGELDKEVRAQLLLSYHKDRKNQIPADRRGGPRPRRRRQKAGEKKEASANSGTTRPEEHHDTGGASSSCAAAAEPMYVPVSQIHAEAWGESEETHGHWVHWPTEEGYPYVSNAWPEPQQEEPRGHIGGASRAMPTASNASSS